MTKPMCVALQAPLGLTPSEPGPGSYRRNAHPTHTSMLQRTAEQRNGLTDKVLAFKSDNLSLIPKTPMVKEK